MLIGVAHVAQHLLYRPSGFLLQPVLKLVDRFLQYKHQGRKKLSPRTYVWGNNDQDQALAYRVQSNTHQNHNPTQQSLFLNINVSMCFYLFNLKRFVYFFSVNQFFIFIFFKPFTKIAYFFQFILSFNRQFTLFVSKLIHFYCLKHIVRFYFYIFITIKSDLDSYQFAFIFIFNSMKFSQIGVNLYIMSCNYTLVQYLIIKFLNEIYLTKSVFL